MTVGVSLSVTTREVRLGAAIRISILGRSLQAITRPRPRRKIGKRHCWIAMVIAIVIVSVFTLDALQLLTPEIHGRVLAALVKMAGGTRRDRSRSPRPSSPARPYQPHQGVVGIGTGRLAEKRYIRRRRSDAASQVR